MSAVAIVRTLLANAAAVTSVVPADRIFAGGAPVNTPSPLISVLSIDGFPRLPVDMAPAPRLITERVQVAVIAASYPQKKDILSLVRAALPLSRGTHATFACDSILPDTTGPDLDDVEAGIFEQSQDFVVKWIDEP